MKKNDVIKSFCNNCKLDTWHKVLFCTEECWQDDKIDIWGERCYSIIQCNGCDEISYRTESLFSEDVYYDSEGNMELEASIELFPKPIKNSVGTIQNKHLLPTIIKKPYEQTLHSISNGDFLLAGIGLRTVVEAICNYEKIKGKNLKGKIDKLATNGFLAKDDANRLHAIRFLGNEAVHEIDDPGIEAIMIALKIIEHLLSSKYVLTQEIESRLKLPIDSYTSFLKLINQRLLDFEEGKTFTINTLLERDKNRIEETLLDTFALNYYEDVKDEKIRTVSIEQPEIEKVLDKQYVVEKPIMRRL